MSKGGNFEREISKELSLWLTCGERFDCVWHTKGSGATATTRKKSNLSKTHDHGDLGPDDPCVNYFFDVFNLELKTGYATKKKNKQGGINLTQWSFLDLIDSSQQNPMFYEFWTQTVLDSIESEREPLLIFRRLRREACIVMHDDIFKCFFDSNSNVFSTDSIRLDLEDYDKIIFIGNMRYFFNWSKEIISESFIKNKVERIIMNRI